jgi:hypothetical protein
MVQKKKPWVRSFLSCEEDTFFVCDDVAFDYFLMIPKENLIVPGMPENGLNQKLYVGTRQTC